MKRLSWLLSILVIVVIMAIFGRRLAPTITVTTFPKTSSQESAGLCPWRNPKSDIAAFFPGSDRYDQRLLILSDLRIETLRKLGPHSRMDANGIYYYKIFQGSRPVGAILAQRTPGEYGVVEYVAAFGTDGKLVGIRIQRIREPDATTKLLELKAWQSAFSGKGPSDAFQLGGDIPAVNGEAQVTAQSLVGSIRRLVIEYNVAHEHGR